MKKTELQTEVQIDEADVDDVVEIATRMMQEEEGQLSLAELQEVGEELDIPPEYIARAREELARQREVAQREAAAEAESKRKLRTTLTYVGLAVAAVVIVWGAIAASQLSDLHAAVEAQAAQVENVVARRATVAAHYADRPDGPDKDAEIVGAENRIRVESKRYADAATAYNAAARKFPAALVRPLTGLPAEVPTLPE